MKVNGYSKKEKLKQKKNLSTLFEKGKWLHDKNTKMIFLAKQTKENQKEDVQKMGISVSKKFFKKATDRNRIKRLLREVYRKNKAEFRGVFGDNYLAMIFWNSYEMPKNYKAVEESFLKFIEKNTATSTENNRQKK
ncbi:MAG: ribonuclease P protein component [Bergeyella sp.]|nr:ribonuclease P protein component [Bergeyella sp.]